MTMRRLRKLLCRLLLRTRYKHADCISPDVPEGHDTVLGYLAKYRPDVLDLFDYADPQWTIRDGYWLMHRARERNLGPVWVDAPPVFQRAGIFQVCAWPLGLLAKRWG